MNETPVEIASKILGENAKIIAPITGGMMNHSFLVEAEGKRYVLYIPTAQANEMVDRAKEKRDQAIVYSLGITSKNVYFDVESGIKCNEFLEGDSLNNIKEFDYKKIASLMHTMHASKTKSETNYDPFTRFEAYEKEAKSFCEVESSEYLELRDTLYGFRRYLESRPLSLCHNDAQRSNIVLSSGEYYFIDFEFAANNDPIYDVACFGNNDVSEGEKLLKEYIVGEDPNAQMYDTYAFYLWRIFISLQWRNVALVKHYRGEGAAHGFDFSKVAEFFLNNAKIAYHGLKSLN